MKAIVHPFASIVATLCIVTFFLSTLIFEVFASFETIALVKSLIVMPGLFILIPAIAITGATGFALVKERKGKIIQAKKKRMPIVALNGLLILLPSAIFLDQWASAGSIDTRFYIVQAVELLAGAVNITLMVMNIRDGRKLTRKYGTTA